MGNMQNSYDDLSAQIIDKHTLELIIQFKISGYTIPESNQDMYYILLWQYN